jgi:hypothetical protein
LLKFDRREGFHQPPLTYDAQITVCPVKFFLPPKEQDPVFNLDSLIFDALYAGVVIWSKEQLQICACPPLPLFNFHLLFSLAYVSG